MVQALIGLMAVVALIGMSLRANARYRRHARLPMQWSFTGSVNWTAPRHLALALTPVLATCILVAAVASTLLLDPRPGQEGLEVPIILILASAFIGAHCLHLWLVGKTLKRNGGLASRS